MLAPGGGLISVVRVRSQPLRYVLLAVGSFAIAVAGAVAGTIADAHHLSGLSHLTTIPAAAGAGLVIGMLRMAFLTGVRVPALARQLASMLQAMEAGEAVTASFKAGLRDKPPGSRPGRWKRGRVLITPESVTWVHSMTGRARDLTGAECTGERQPDLGYLDVSLVPPTYYKGENVRVISLRANGTDVELAAPAQLLEAVTYSLARVALGTGQTG